MTQDLTSPHRILRRLAARIRAEAIKIDDKSIVMKLILMATELEDLAADQRPSWERRN